MPRCHRSHRTEFKQQVVAEYHSGEALHALGRRHDSSRNLIRMWIEKTEAGALNEDVAAAELLAEDYERAERSSWLRHWFEQPVDDAEIHPGQGQGPSARHPGRAEQKAEANAAFDFSKEAYGVKWDKAVAKLIKDRDALFVYNYFPVAH